MAAPPVVYVYFLRRNSEAAEALAVRLREATPGLRVVLGNAKYFDDDLPGDAAKVFHDGLVPEVAEVARARGVPTQMFVDSSRPKRGGPEFHDPEVGRREHEEAVAAIEKMRATPEGYTIEHKAPWYTVYGPKGEKVGKSTRTPEEALDVAHAHAGG